MADDDFMDSDKKREKGKEKSAKQGRRAAKAKEEEQSAPAAASGIDDDDDFMIATDTKRAPARDAGAPPRPSRRGGWGHDSAKTSANNVTSKLFKKGRKDAGDDIEDERLRPRSPPMANDESDNDMPAIPELEDSNVKAGESFQVAMAPHVAVNRVATYKELDNELLKHAAFLMLDNEIDLKLLSRGMSAEEDVREDDTPWEWDRLFTEVTSELLAEWENQEKMDEEKIVS